MPRSVEHIVETHSIARQRRDAGQPIWDRRIQLGDVFHNDALSFEEKRDVIVARIRKSGWLDAYDEYDELPQLVEELSETTDGNDFDGPWDAIYDYADTDRVWIATV